MIPYSRQSISDEDVDAVARALRDPLLTQGPAVGRFEEALAATVGARFAVAFNSGTAALHAAYHAAGVGPGRGVLTTPITFAATANAALYLGAPIAFADVDAATALLSPDAVAEAITNETAVIAPVHFAGQPADMERIARVAEYQGAVVVEDAAHAIGATYQTKDGSVHRVGSCTHSAMCCFSFHPVKHFTTGEGGAVTTNSEVHARALRRFRTHGITRDPGELTTDEGPWYYEQHDLGFNYRITDFQCALGLSQLARLDAFVQRRRALAGRYDRALLGQGQVRPLKERDGACSSYHLYVVRVRPAVRRAVIEGLRADGVGANVHYIPVYRHPYYRRRLTFPPRCPNAEQYYSEAISLPLYPDLTEGEQDHIIASLLRLVSE